MVRQSILNMGRLYFVRKSLNSHLSSCFCSASRKCSGTIKKQPTFEEVVSQRRLEARRSLVVQVSSKTSFHELYEYCTKYADIQSVHHYNNFGGETFMLIEFGSEENLKEVLCKCGSHQKASDIMALPSPFLWFRVLPQKKSKNPPHTSSQNLTSSDGNQVLSFEDIYKELAECSTVTEQIQKLYDSTVLNEVGIRLRYLVARQLEMVLSSLYANIAVRPFGSSVNGFGKMGCDLDLVLTNVITDSMSDAQKRLVYQEKQCEGGRSAWQRHMGLVSEMLELRVPGATRVQRILHARVPIVKYTHHFTDTQCDVCYNNLTGVYMSELLWLFGNMDPRVRPMAFAVRRWAQAAGLTNPHPGRWITNFPLTLMVIFFLQQKTRDGAVLPTLNYLIKNAGKEDTRIAEENINCTFLRDIEKIPNEALTTNNASLEKLLFQFFEYYAQFDFGEKAITIREGHPIRKPNSLPLYIVNPLEPALNVSRNVSFEELERIRAEVRNAAWQLETLSANRKAEDWGILGLLESKQSRGLKKLVRVGNSHRLVSVKDLFQDDLTETDRKSDEEIETKVKEMKSEMESSKSKDKERGKFKNQAVESAVHRIRRDKLL